MMKIEFSCEFVRLESRRITLYIVVDCVSQGFNKHEKDVRFVFKIDTAYHTLSEGVSGVAEWEGQWKTPLPLCSQIYYIILCRSLCMLRFATPPF